MHVKSSVIASVIIPAFNSESTVGDAIRSCLAQSLSNIEVIVIDDASSDQTSHAVRLAANGDARVKLITLPTNIGVARARNNGLNIATGDWIALLDADDTFMPERLQQMIRLAESKGADMLADNLRVSFKEKTLPSRLAFPEERMRASAPITAAQLAAADRPRWGLPAAGFMKPIIRREFLESRQIRYVEDRTIVEDFHLYMQCLFHGAKLFYIPDAYYLYSVDERSLSRANSTKVRERLVNSSRQLCLDAEIFGDADALVELRRRDHDLKLWLSFKACEAAMKEKRYRAAFIAFMQQPSKKYALIRIAGQARYSFALRLGINLQVRDRRSSTWATFIKRKLFGA